MYRSSGEIEGYLTLFNFAKNNDRKFKKNIFNSDVGYNYLFV